MFEAVVEGWLKSCSHVSLYFLIPRILFTPYVLHKHDILVVCVLLNSPGCFPLYSANMLKLDLCVIALSRRLLQV